MREASDVPPLMFPFLLLREEEGVDSLHTRSPQSPEKLYPAWSGVPLQVQNADFY